MVDVYGIKLLSGQRQSFGQRLLNVTSKSSKQF